ncbi:MAG: hypothetical protein ACI9XZ_003608, partial [Alphaproteobacteria bacterium]
MSARLIDNASVVSKIIIEVPDDDNIAFPNGNDLFGGDFARDGFHLTITGSDGQQYLIKDYFNNPTPGDFVAPNGAILSSEHATRLAGPRMAGYAQAASQAASTMAQQIIGTIKTLEGGSATATRPDGSKIELKVGSAVYEGDIIQTGAGAKMSIVFTD